MDLREFVKGWPVDSKGVLPTPSDALRHLKRLGLDVVHKTPGYIMLESRKKRGWLNSKGEWWVHRRAAVQQPVAADIG